MIAQRVVCLLVGLTVIVMGALVVYDPQTLVIGFTILGLASMFDSPPDRIPNDEDLRAHYRVVDFL